MKKKTDKHLIDRKPDLNRQIDDIINHLKLFSL